MFAGRFVVHNRQPRRLTVVAIDQATFRRAVGRVCNPWLDSQNSVASRVWPTIGLPSVQPQAHATRDVACWRQASRGLLRPRIVEAPIPRADIDGVGGLSFPVYVDHWVDAQNRSVDFGKLPLNENEMLPAGALDDAAPDEQRLTEATGNEGASFERSYRRAASCLWPRNLPLTCCCREACARSCRI